MTSFWNVLLDDTFDSLATGISLHCLASARANRWRIVAPTFLQETTGLDLSCVDGIQIIAPYFDQLTGAALSLGASADGVQVFEATQETEAGGWFLTVDSAANAFQVLGFRNYGGRLYQDGTAQLGTRAFFLGDWADGLNWSSASAATPVSTLAPNADGGLQASGIDTIAVGGGVAETSSGVTCSMAAAASCKASVPSGSVHCAAYAQGNSAYYAACEISGTTATVTANVSNSATWLVVATQ